MVSHIVVSDCNESLKKDFESIIRFCSIWWVEGTVDILGNKLVKDAFAIDELFVLNVQVNIAES